MKKILLILSILFALSLTAVVFAVDSVNSKVSVALIPWPVKVKTGDDNFIFKPGTRLISSEEIADVSEMLREDINERFALKINNYTNSDINGYILIIGENGSAYSGELIPPGQDESYSIRITPSHVLLVANDKRGVYWGTRTLLQLLKSVGDKWVLPTVDIDDWPRFRRRGLLVDPARNFISISYLKRTIDILADFKFNVLHLHMTDDQGWRFESKTHPKLQDIGGQSLYYSQDDLRELIEYADRRGIEVLPEIDMPGHVTAMLAAYPELSCTGKQVKVSKHYGILPGAICPSKGMVYDFIDELIAEIVAVFPSEFIHIGSDEVLAYEWEKCPDCLKLTKERKLVAKKGLHSYFLKRVDNIIGEYGKRMIAWDEVTEFAPSGTVIQAWRNKEMAYTSVKSGKETLCGPIGSTYLNYSRFILPLRKCYNFEPTPNGLDPDEEALMLGGGASLWGNYLTSENEIDRYLYPRLLAMSEVYWSQKDVRDYSNFRKRLAPIRLRLEERGVEFGDMGLVTLRDTLKIAGVLAEGGAHLFKDRLLK